jgi:hypothetical protein
MLDLGSGLCCAAGHIAHMYASVNPSKEGTREQGRGVAPTPPQGACRVHFLLLFWGSATPLETAVSPGRQANTGRQLVLSYTRHWLGERSPLGRAAALLPGCPPPTTSTMDLQCGADRHPSSPFALSGSSVGLRPRARAAREETTHAIAPTAPAGGRSARPCKCHGSTPGRRALTQPSQLETSPARGRASKCPVPSGAPEICPF